MSGAQDVFAPAPDTGHLLWRWPADEGLWAAPLRVYRGIVFARTYHRLITIDAATECAPPN